MIRKIFGLLWAGLTVSFATEGATTHPAIDALLGKNDSMNYVSARAVLEQAAEAGNIEAKRMRVVMWLTNLPHEAHRLSFTNAFLFLRVTPEIDSQAILSRLPDPNSEELRALSDVDGFKFTSRVDPLTDESHCRLETAAVKGLSFGFDDQGAYIGSTFPLSLTGFESMGVRFDKYPYHPGEQPKAVTDYKRRLDALETLLVHKEISIEEAQKFRPKEPSITRFYLADGIGEAQIQLLRELSIASQVVLRVFDRSGAERILTIPLQGHSAGATKSTLADFPAYAYSRCAFSTTAEN